MSNDPILSQPSDVPIYLSGVADKLAAGSITRDEAHELLEGILLDAALWESFPPDHVASLRESWTNNFASREAVRDRAATAGRQAANADGFDEDDDEDVLRLLGRPPVNDALREQARLALALSEKRKADNAQESAVRALINSLKGDSRSSSIDKSKFDFSSGSSSNYPSDMHPDAAQTIITADFT